MHPNPIFRDTETKVALDFARTRGFGTLTLNGPDHPLLAHVPVLINADGTALELHVMRSNPIWTALETPQQGLVAITGPDGYISPDWYGLPDQVPTWNYVAVHLKGTLSRLPEHALRGVLDRLSAHFEAGLAPKAPWTAKKMTPGVMERMMRMIVPVSMTITGVESTWKLNQNKPAEARLGAAAEVTTGSGSDLAVLGALMQAPPNLSE